MIQVYSADNTTYTKNGDSVLLPTQATVTAELNGVWTAHIEHPLDEDGRWKYITDGAVIKMPSFNGEQLFRVRYREKSDFNVMAELDPIFYDSAKDCFLVDVRPTEKNGQDALDILTANNIKYSAESNITKISTAYYEYMNLMEALSGEQDNAFIKRWGGEIEYDNFKVIINARLGADNGFELRYGKNIGDVGEIVNMQGVVTRIYPKGFNGAKLSTFYVDSPLINTYPTISAATMTFDYIKFRADLQEEDVSNAGIVICDTQEEMDTALAEACQAQFDAGVDKPDVTIQIANYVDLSKIDGYTEGALMLGDTVHLWHSLLDIHTTARVVGLTYDAVEERISGLTIGKLPYNYFNAISSTINRVDIAIRENGTVRAETVGGILDMSKANLYAQYDIAERQNVLGILFENNDATSDLYGAMAIGTQGFMIANTKDGSGNWQWNTWGTAKGLVADYIVAGVLRSVDGSSFWDLNDSDFVFYEDETQYKMEIDKGRITFYQNGQKLGCIRRLVYRGDEGEITGSVFAITSGPNETQYLYLDEINDRVTLLSRPEDGSYDTRLELSGGSYAYLSAGEDQYIRMGREEGDTTIRHGAKRIKLSDSGNDIELYAGEGVYQFFNTANGTVRIQGGPNVFDNLNAAAKINTMSAGASTYFRLDDNEKSALMRVNDSAYIWMRNAEGSEFINLRANENISLWLNAGSGYARMQSRSGRHLLLSDDDATAVELKAVNGVRLLLDAQSDAARLEGGDVYVKLDGSGNAAYLFVNGTMYCRAINGSDQYMDFHAGDDVWIRLDQGAGKLWLNGTQFNINGYAAQSGTVVTTDKTLYFRNGIVTSMSDTSPSFTTPTISQNRCTISSGGWYQVGKRVYVQLYCTNKHTRTATTQTQLAFMSGFPTPRTSYAPLAITWNAVAGFACRINNNGALQIMNGPSMTFVSDVTFEICGSYLTS